MHVPLRLDLAYTIPLAPRSVSAVEIKGEKGPDYEIFNLYDAAASSDGKSVAGVRS